MEIQEFLDLSVGNWFCQRTTYLLNPEKAENSKSEMTITPLDSAHPDSVRLRQEHHLDTNQTLVGIKSAWNNSVDWGKPKIEGSSLLVVVPDQQHPHTGKLLQSTNLKDQPSLLGNYLIGKDDALTLTVTTPEMTISERIWFPSANFRLRTSFIEAKAGWIKTSFYSEIRKMSPS
ncbi:phycobiliprotein lyase [Gloeocapsa sp. PCC 73106]|uniref:phycobiliprotein lyase n=1 Tax=Gloeocapsa sp. PCC 73106 TaxID=102232 RepID=UPI0002ACDA01|nr:phycobiliprotein lyase [Gloeocapsa sp. PCC 73106]ELR97323.1 phycobilin lyase, CpcU subunit [Gloeocapsa sp. PCC 73106]